MYLSAQFTILAAGPKIMSLYRSLIFCIFMTTVKGAD